MFFSFPLVLSMMGTPPGFGLGKQENNWCVPFPCVHANCSNMYQNTQPRGCGSPPQSAPKAPLVCVAVYLSSLHIHQDMVYISHFFFSKPKPGGGVYIQSTHFQFVAGASPECLLEVTHF